MRKPKRQQRRRRKKLTAAEVQERRAHAFWEMEAPLRDCFQRAEIATILMGQGRSELAEDIVYELEEMLGALRSDYRKGASTRVLPGEN
jgi:hypothetical protein